MTKNDDYRARLGTLQDALDLIRSGDCIAVSTYGNEPSGFLSRLHTVAPRVRDVHVWTMLMMGDYPVMTEDALKGRIDIDTYFYNADCRRGHAGGRFALTPTDLHNAARTTIAARRPTVCVCAVSPMDENGYLYLSFDLQAAKEWIEAADRVIFEVDPSIPRVYGDTAVPVEMADLIYEAPPHPIPRAPLAPPTPEETQVAEYVASLIHDGDCIQLGIGGIPGAVGEALLHKQDLGIHTEMITASMGRLMEAGAVNNRRKNLHPGKTVGAFAWGDQPLYDLLADNPMVELRRSSYTNDPFVIAQNDNMVSVNTAIQIDLTGQICSESIGARQFSGTGGASDFAFGAYHSKGGRGIIAITSTAKGGTVSKIQPLLTPGAVVSISRNLADYVVTEYGIAKLRERNIRQRVDALISVAHPNFRAQMRRQADALMLW